MNVGGTRGRLADDPGFRRVVTSMLAGVADVPPPPRAAALLAKDQLTRERLLFTVRQALQPRVIP